MRVVRCAMGNALNQSAVREKWLRCQVRGGYAVRRNNRIQIRWSMPMRFVLAVFFVVTFPVSAAEPPAQAAATKPPTAAQQERLKKRDHCFREAQRLRREGKLEEAITATEKMLAIGREVFGDVHADVAFSLEMLARMHEQREAWDAAHKACEEALAVRTKLHGEKNWRVTEARFALESINKLASLTDEQRRKLREARELDAQEGRFYRQGKYSEAVAIREKTHQIRSLLLGEKHPDYALSLNNLAYIYWVQGNFAQAEPLYRQALEINKQLLGEKHFKYANILNNLACLYKDQGDYARAEPLYRQALVIRKQVLGEKHPDYAQSLGNLALLYHAQGNYAQAEPLCRQALEINKHVLGEKHPDYARSLNGWQSSTMLRGTTRRPSRSAARRWKSTSRCWVRNIPTTPPA